MNQCKPNMNRKTPAMAWVNACLRCGLLVLLAGCSAGAAGDAGRGVAPVNIADAALSGGMPQAALNVTSSILQSDPRNVAALVRQGAALTQLNQPDAAMEAYRRALAVDPSAPGALLGLGRLELSRGSASDAEHSFSTLLQRAPNDRVAQNDLGVALDLQGRHEAAQVVYAKLLRMDPGNRAAAVNQALSLSLSGQAERSVALLRGPAARADASPRVRQDLAVALTLSGNKPEAENCCSMTFRPATPQQPSRGIRP